MCATYVQDAIKCNNIHSVFWEGFISPKKNHLCTIPILTYTTQSSVEALMKQYVKQDFGESLK